MKKLFLLLVLVWAISCEREDENSTKESLIGNWEWISSTGGIDGRTETPASTGKQVKIVITKDSVKVYENSVLKQKNSYKISREKSVLDNKIKDMIIYNSGFRDSFMIDSQNQLHLIGDCFDCFASLYKKAENQPSQARQIASF